MYKSAQIWSQEHIEDVRRYRREWYHRNKAHAIKKIKDRVKETRQWLNEYKSNLKCEQCGMNHPATLQFHHINPKKKDRDLSQASHYGWGKDRILKEIKKCKILCANCHFIHHWNENK